MASLQKAKKREGKRVEPLSVTLLLLFLLLMGWRLAATREKMTLATAERETLAWRIVRQEQENRSLEAALAHAEDPAFLQELARETLDMVSPGQKDFYDVGN